MYGCKSCLVSSTNTIKLRFRELYKLRVYVIE